MFVGEILGKVFDGIVVKRLLERDIHMEKDIHIHLVSKIVGEA